MGAIDLVVLVKACDLHVGRDFHHFELVDVEQFVASVNAVPVMPESFSYIRK